MSVAELIAETPQFALYDQGLAIGRYAIMNKQPRQNRPPLVCTSNSLIMAQYLLTMAVVEQKALAISSVLSDAQDL